MQKLLTIGLASCLAVTLLTSCASTSNMTSKITPKSRFIVDPAERAMPVNATASAEKLTVTVDSLIYPNGPGSWIKDADWDEYILKIKYAGNSPVTIRSVEVIDIRGVHVAPGASIAELQARASTLSAEYQSFGVVFSKQVGINSAVIAASVIPSVAAAGYLGAAAVVAAPLAAIAAPAYAMWHVHTKKVDRERIEAAFASRQVHLPMVIEAGAELQSSVFFPPAASPKALSISYLGERGESRVRVDLADVLKGLHLAGDTRR